MNHYSIFYCFTLSKLYKNKSWLISNSLKVFIMICLAQFFSKQMNHENYILIHIIIISVHYLYTTCHDQSISWMFYFSIIENLKWVDLIWRCYDRPFLTSKRIEIESSATFQMEENFKDFPTVIYIFYFINLCQNIIQT